MSKLRFKMTMSKVRDRLKCSRSRDEKSSWHFLYCRTSEMGETRYMFICTMTLFLNVDSDIGHCPDSHVGLAFCVLLSCQVTDTVWRSHPQPLTHRPPRCCPWPAWGRCARASHQWRQAAPRADDWSRTSAAAAPPHGLVLGNRQTPGTPLRPASGQDWSQSHCRILKGQTFVN